MLMDAGYDNVKTIEGGFAAWKDSGYPLAEGMPE